ncbi:MAG: hypothetical protein ISN28_02235 [Ectothiorhodospiraceae bacterium AqS1]|nr:hypothetical protein [Ectothiorhodospiraceae bacterium AqS1]
MKRTHQSLDVNSVHLDVENPRIRNALEKYDPSEKTRAERIYLALQTGGEEGSAMTGFFKLKSSIRAMGGISSPISVIERNGQRICIDGNTRLAIYQEFLGQDAEGDWGQIPAMLISDATQSEIEEIRATAHLVGARQWPAYEKAKYLHDQYYNRVMPASRLLELCGGNKKDLMRQVDAYSDMEEHYRKRLSNSEDFDHTRFSGFLELQSSGRKRIIFDAGYSLDDFADWLKDGRIRRLEDVRLLPKVLNDEDAKKVFVNGKVDSIKAGARIVEDKLRSNDQESMHLSTISLAVLSQEIEDRINNLPWREIQVLRNDDETLNVLEGLKNSLTTLLQEVLSHGGK